MGSIGPRSPSSRLLAGRLIWLSQYRRRWGSLGTRCHVQINEPLGAGTERCVGIVGPVEHVIGDFLGHIPGPSLDGIEGDDPERVPVLPRNHVADDRTEIGFSNVRRDGGDGARERSEFGANGLGTLADSESAEASREQKRAIIARDAAGRENGVRRLRGSWRENQTLISQRPR
jgi:hypothetical protein